MYRNRSISTSILRALYLDKKLSAAQIAKKYQCSEQKIHYWLARYGIPKRSKSDAAYVKRNPKGDPFLFAPPRTAEESFLYGLGLGLYWGEGNKRNKATVRLGNTDPELVKAFIKFLIRIYKVPKEKFRFGIQIFSDMPQQEALSFWSRELGFPRSQFGKVIVTPARGAGTYTHKIRHGVLTVYVSNIKLRNLLISQIEKLR